MDRLELTKLPDAIGTLKNLRYLSLAFNEIKTLPASFYELRELRELKVLYVPLSSATKAALAKRLPKCKLVEK